MQLIFFFASGTLARFKLERVFLTYKLGRATCNLVGLARLKYTRHSKVNQLEVFFTVRTDHTKHILGLSKTRKD